MNDNVKKHKNKTVYERLMQKVDVPSDIDSCWEYKGCLNNAGYGLISGDRNYNDPKMITAHRAMARHIGLDIKQEIQHTCLNKKCVNPKHLIIGDSKTRDKRLTEKYGRHFRRPKNPTKTCPHCNETSYVNWYSRKHKFCDGKIFEKYSHLNKKQV